MKRASLFFVIVQACLLALGSAGGGEFQPYDSGPLRGEGPAQPVSINVSGVKILRLLTFCEKGTANCNIWGEPRLIATDGTVTPLTGLKPVDVTVGWGSLLINTNWLGNPLRVGDRTFADGFWVHADSELRFDLNGKYERFEAYVGEDGDRANGVVRFEVRSGDPVRPMPPAELHTAEFNGQFAALARDMGRRAEFDKIEGETFHRASLILPSDRDPAVSSCAGPRPCWRTWGARRSSSRWRISGAVTGTRP